MTDHVEPVESAEETPEPAARQGRRMDRRGFLAIAGLTTVGVVWAANSGSQQARAATVPDPCGSPSPTPTPTPTSTGGGTGTFAVPIDSAKHTRTWMAWPDDPTIWTGGAGGRRGSSPSVAQIQSNIARVANTIAKYEPVIMCANPASASSARAACTNPNVTVITSIPVNDCWMRDSGPVFRTNGAGGLDAVGLNFNGWGGQQTVTNDAKVAQLVAAYAGVPFTAAGFVSEGGAIEADGLGTLMATQSSIVDPKRNPNMTQAQLESAMCAAYGATKVIWFPGISGQDITNDHVDATSRFVGAGTALVQTPNPADPADIWSNDEQQQYNLLSAAANAQGTAMQVTKLQAPDYNYIRQTSTNFVDSYANYYVCNGAVISAQFGDTTSDANAKAVLAGMFPGRVIEQINIDYIGLGGGGIHCVTQPQPAP
ncbi:agmatine deiminase family protein [Streptacidiphilus jiangxiensis]|uniref:Agmatine deiminase n=1 Tax=Streptacidiphilus jiangxiensis TaxID=235985 RepID=A0A1H7T0E5_STRJI|nr:agmatine deiminase family protein [Streptacidiphilus jiangxiensis]SEL78303.1 agmatine deiminase [Streptacidiphilus jiangxiensis]